jgi:hypothetical protein
MALNLVDQDYFDRALGQSVSLCMAPPCRGQLSLACGLGIERRHNGKTR